MWRRTARCLSSTTVNSQLLELAHQLPWQQQQQQQLPSTELLGAVWTRTMETLKTAVGTREVDGTLSLVNRVISLGYSPSSVDWKQLFKSCHLADIEARSVLQYRVSSSTGAQPPLPSSVEPELLRLTSGVVPLTLRAPCASGFAVLSLLRRWAACQEDSSMSDDLALCIVDTLIESAKTVDVDAVVKIGEIMLRVTSSSDVDSKWYYLVEALDTDSDMAPQHAAAVAAALAEQIMADGITSFLTLERGFRTLNVLRRRYSSRVKGSDRTAVVDQLARTLDFALQRNQNEGNPFDIDEVTADAVRHAALEARIRCRRVEMAVTEDFPDWLQQEVRSTHTTLSFGMLHEVLMWHLRVHEEENRKDIGQRDLERLEVVRSDLVRTLRNLVDARPRDDSMDADAKALFQSAHRRVIALLCETRDEKWISEAYLIVVMHKYHQLTVDTALVMPLLEALGRRGDGRVFNLVDLVTLYSGNKVNFAVVGHLFRACQVAGDYHRAKALYALLKESFPGFLARAPESVTLSLRDLGILSSLPGNFFDRSDERQPRSLSASAAAATEKSGSEKSFGGSSDNHEAKAK